ncbi:3-dehydroquinate synthase [Euzebya tangerina]|uniref:3-dehydroquinate synthase n=1 Tax=Euzebya tangerina TaxID=591198 RepID=UPI0013C2D1B6|nr:3-dehydroquinate synthase [Euzebya tangerina]
MTTAIPVHLGARSYDIHVGAGILDQLDELVPWPTHARTAVVITNGVVADHYGGRVAAAIERAGLVVRSIRVPDGEQAKSTDTLAQIWQRMAGVPLLRDDVVIALGGGVVGDLAGFAAATWNRGVALVQVPTTLLAQVDSAIGGKTGINLAQGKNLVGAFHQPLAVISDVEVLATLPSRERRAGLGEVAKYGFIADPVVLDLLEDRPGSATAGDPAVLAEIVRRGSTVKAEVVSEDEFESGRRALLNYGHTIGHAIESLTAYDTYRHGEAVGLGMVAAAQLGERLGISEPGLADRTISVLDGLGLPTRGLRLDPRDVWQVMARDKKARDGVRFIISERPGKAIVIDEPRRSLVDDIIRGLA